MHFNCPTLDHITGREEMAPSYQQTRWIDQWPTRFGPGTHLVGNKILSISSFAVLNYTNPQFRGGDNIHSGAESDFLFGQSGVR